MPSEPVMVNIAVFICSYRLKRLQKYEKKAETRKDVPLSVKENAVFENKLWYFIKILLLVFLTDMLFIFSKFALANMSQSVVFVVL